MNEPRAPDNQKSWEAIDIYLFSNGQQYSPPRKYHLRSEELNWWEATLGYLARSQYGSMHKSLVLYTIDGRKIGSPTELRDGVAYVAVIPPDTFIQAGYENYLIKASRSWEKRQKKSLQGEAADTTTVERDQTDQTEINNIPEQNSNTQTVGMIKSAYPDNSQQRKKHLPKIPVSTTKTSEKRKLNSAQALQRSSVPNKQLRDPAPPPLFPRRNLGSRRESQRQEGDEKIGLKDNEKKENQRKSLEKRTGVRKENEVRPYERQEGEKKEDEKKEFDKKLYERKERPQRDNDRREGKKGLIKEMSKKIFNKLQDESLLTTSNKSTEKVNVNTISKTKQKEIIVPTKLEPGVSETEILFTAKSVLPHHKSQITENDDVEDVINDKELIVVTNLFKSTDSEEGSTCVDPNNVLITLHAHKEKLKSETKTLEPVTEDEKSIVTRNSNTLEDTSIKYPISSANDHALAISPIETPTKDLKARENPTKGQVIVVQSKTIPKQNVQDFQISEIKLTKDTENNPIKYLVTVVPDTTDADNLKLTLDARKSEDTKQRNDVQKSLSFVNLREETEKEKVTQSKSVPSLTNVYPPHMCCQRNRKVVVLPCACCDYYPQENKCKREQPQFGTDFNNYFILLPITGFPEKQCCRPCCQKDINTSEKQVQNTESLITEFNCQEVTTYPGSKTNAEFEMKEFILTSTVSVVKSNSHRSLNSANRESALVAINNVQQTDSVCLKRASFESSPALCDKSVQTDWCNIMLEVRKHEDGHYTFHLPSLEVLKSHNVS